MPIFSTDGVIKLRTPSCGSKWNVCHCFILFHFFFYSHLNGSRWGKSYKRLILAIISTFSMSRCLTNVQIGPKLNRTRPESVFHRSLAKRQFTQVSEHLIGFSWYRQAVWIQEVIVWDILLRSTGTICHVSAGITTIYGDSETLQGGFSLCEQMAVFLFRVKMMGFFLVKKKFFFCFFKKMVDFVSCKTATDIFFTSLYKYKRMCKLHFFYTNITECVSFTSFT